MRVLGTIVLWWRLSVPLLLYRTDDEPRLLAAAIVFHVCATTTFVGWRTKASTWGLAAALSYLFFVEGLFLGDPEFRPIQQYWILPVCLALTDCGRSFSVDRWLELVRAERDGRPPSPEYGSLVGMRLLAIEVSSIYLWGALDKSDVHFLAGERLDRIWMAKYGSSDYPRVWWFRPALLAAAWGTVTWEYVMAFGLWNAKVRVHLIALGLVVHTIFAAVLPVSAFSLMMWVGYLAFVPPREFDRIVRRLTAS